MRRLLIARLPRKGSPSDLDSVEAHHAVKVLRLRDGEMVEALDGQNHAIQAVIRVRGDKAFLEFHCVLEVQADQQVAPITLEAAVLKGNAMEWVIEKAVELGVSRLVPVITEFTVVQLKEKGPETFQARWQRIADQALKQCGRFSKMEVALPLELGTLMTTKVPLRFWCDEKASEPFVANAYTPELTQYHLLIGPEGGWSEREREFLSRDPQLKRVSLGPLTLRAETASLFAVSAILTELLKK